MNLDRSPRTAAMMTGDTGAGSGRHAVFAVGDAVELVGAYDLEAGVVGTVVGTHPDNRTYRVAFPRGRDETQTCDVPYLQLRHHADERD
jgi:hypothetical protein